MYFESRIVLRISTLSYRVSQKQCPLGYHILLYYIVTCNRIFKFFHFFINEHITLIVAFFRTKIFNRSPSRVT
jgi:hypothetical protein